MHPFPSPLFARGIGAITYIASGSGTSSGTDFNISTAGLSVGHMMMVFADLASGQSSSMTGGTGTGWTYETVTQSGGDIAICHRKILEAGDISTTLTCVLVSNGTTCRYVVYDNVASVDLMQTVSSAPSAADIQFTIISNPTSMLVSSVCQINGSSVSWSSPANWTNRVNQTTGGAKTVFDLNTLAYSAPSLTFTPTTTYIGGQTGMLYMLTGY